jgi:uncharacterized protein YukE
MKLHVVRSEVLSAVSNLSRALEEFTDATKEAHAAAEVLYNGWEGDRQKDFVQEEEKSQQCFQEMAKNVTNYVAALKVAEDSYGDVDRECARLIRSN